MFKDAEAAEKANVDKAQHVITMCGSTKFKEDYLREEKRLTMEGCIVLSCPFFNHADGCDMSEYDTERLTELHRERIKMSDSIFVVNKGGYIGDATGKEIEFAESINKDVIYMEYPGQHKERLETPGAIIMVIGSYSDRAKIVGIIREMTLQGELVIFNPLMITGLPVAGPMTDSKHHQMQVLVDQTTKSQFERIRMADKIHVIIPPGKPHENSVFDEIQYAKSIGKEIYYYWRHS